jgi:hypothetical protein
VPASLAFVRYCLALCTGVSFVFQQAVNSNLRAEMGSSWGTIAMLLMPWPLQMMGSSHWMS